MCIYAMLYELWSVTVAAWRGRDAHHGLILAHRACFKEIVDTNDFKKRYS